MSYEESIRAYAEEAIRSRDREELVRCIEWLRDQLLAANYTAMAMDAALRKVTEPAAYGAISAAIAKDLIHRDIQNMPAGDFKRFLLEHGGAEWREE